MICFLALRPDQAAGFAHQEKARRQAVPAVSRLNRSSLPAYALPIARIGLVMASAAASLCAAFPAFRRQVGTPPAARVAVPRQCKSVQNNDVVPGRGSGHPRQRCRRGVTAAASSAVNISGSGSMSSTPDDGSRICVVGGGVIGRTAALRIKQALPGAAVTLVAEQYDDTTSHGAAGLWKPFTLVRLSCPLRSLCLLPSCAVPPPARTTRALVRSHLSMRACLAVLGKEQRSRPLRALNPIVGPASPEPCSRPSRGPCLRRATRLSRRSTAGARRPSSTTCTCTSLPTRRRRASALPSARADFVPEVAAGACGCAQLGGAGGAPLSHS